MPAKLSSLASAPDEQNGGPRGEKRRDDEMAHWGCGTTTKWAIVAAALGLINSARLARGQPTIGFANPWLYELSARGGGAFNDVSVGSNGYPAAKGWDAVTGLGSLDVGAILKADKTMWEEWKETSW